MQPKDVQPGRWSSMRDLVAQMGSEYGRDVKAVWGRLIEQHNTRTPTAVSSGPVETTVLPVDGVKRLFVATGDLGKVERECLHVARRRIDRANVSFLDRMEAPEPAFAFR